MATPRTLGSAFSRATSSRWVVATCCWNSCSKVPSWSAVGSIRGTRMSADRYSLGSIPMPSVRSLSTPRTSVPPRVRKHTAMATSAMMRPVDIPPKRMPEAPAVARCRLRWMPPPVALSAGTTPATTALPTAKSMAQAALSTVTPRSMKNGISPSKYTWKRFTRVSARTRPIPAASTASNSVSTKSWETMRARPAPRALRMDSSLARDAVRAKMRIPTLPHATRRRSSAMTWTT